MRISQVLEISSTINSFFSFMLHIGLTLNIILPFVSVSLSVSPVPATAVSGGADASPKSA